MRDEKGIEDMESKKSQENFSTDTNTRARNRTVMLSPDVTGHVRAMLAKEGQQAADSSGYSSPTPAADARSTYAPAGERASAPIASEPVVPQRRPVMAPPVASVSSSPKPQVVAKAPLVGFLVSFDADSNGEVFELRTGRWIISSEQTTAGNYIIINDDTVSPLHAIMRVSATGEIQVLDQLSEHGTGIKRFGTDKEEPLTGAMSTVEHGDIVRFGERKFHVCVISIEGRE